MSILITPAAAQFLLARVSKEQLPLRLMKVEKGCGDVAHRFDYAAHQCRDDTLVEAHGLTLVCDLFENEEFENALIDLHRKGEGSLASERIVVIPDGATICGCGESARMPEKKN